MVLIRSNPSEVSRTRRLLNERLGCMATEQEEIAKKCWQTGSKATASQNWDYAIEMFLKAVQLCPQNPVYRQSLRGAETKKYNNNKKGAGILSKPKLVALRGKTQKARISKKWDDVDRLAEEGLKLNPWDAQLNADVGLACSERDFNEVAIFAYQLAVSPDGDPDNKNFLYSLAELYHSLRKYDEAKGVYQKIYKIDPNEAEARRKITEMDAEKTRDVGGYDEAENTRGVMADHEVNKRLKRGKPKDEEEVDGPGQSSEADILHAIRKDPKNRDLRLKLGDFYRKDNHFDQAIEAYEKADELSGGDLNIKEQIEDVRIDRMTYEFDKATQEASRNPGDKALKKNAQDIGFELLEFEIDVLSKRVKRYPADMRMKYELARRYRRMKKWSEAIPLLQQASSDHRLEVPAVVALGKCFLQDERPQMALRQFKKIEPKLSFNDNGDVYKEVHYYMGRVEERLSNNDEACRHYSEVLAVDYDFRDVRARLERLEGGGTSGSHSVPPDAGS